MKKHLSKNRVQKAKTRDDKIERDYKNVVTLLADKYHVSERHVQKVLKH